MNKEIKILFVEDLLTDAELIWRELAKNNISFRRKLVDNREEYTDSLGNFEPDLILADYSLPGFNGMEALAIRNREIPLTPFILVTGHVNEEVAVECMKSGADDYVLKDNLSRLSPAIINALKKHQLTKEKMDSDARMKDALERLDSIFRVAPAGIGIIRSRIILEVNHYMCIMTGYTRDELIGNDARMLYSTAEEYDSVGSEKYRQMNKTGMGIMETRWMKKDGTLINILLSSTWLQPQDHDKGAIFTALDITTRKKSEEDLKQSQTLLQNAMRIARMGSWEYDVNTDRFHFNDLFYSVYNSSFELEGSYEMSSAEYANRFVHPDDLHLVSDEIRKVIESTDPDYNCQVEHRIIYADGQQGYINVRFYAIKDENGKTIKTFGINQDITEQKRTESELIRAKEKAEESDRLKTAFLHNISHEIRTPLNAIVGFSSLLSEPGLDENSCKSFTEMILKSSDHLLAIISDIIDIACIEANTVKINKSNVSLDQVINSLYEQYLPVAKNKGLILRSGNGIKEAETVIVTDKTRLIQILTNLLDNAIKYTPAGEVSFGYRYKPKEEMIEFYVSDTGIGIPPEHQGKIFDRFYQAENPVSKMYEGTGLGLSISKAFAELLGGKISLSSKPSEGSCFCFTLPVEKQPGTDSEAIPRKMEPEIAFTKKKRILVAEDIESNFRLINYLLTSCNAEVIRASNGQEAVEIATSDKNIDLILMDIKMPVMDGYSATKLLRDNGFNKPIIAQTAFSDDKAKALDNGCSEIIIKPFDRKGLFQVLRKFI